MTLSNLTLAATGALPAVVSNFTFAANGTLGVEGELPNGMVTLPVSFVSATDAGNISGWKLEINGVENMRYQFKADNSGIVLWKRGFVVSFR